MSALSLTRNGGAAMEEEDASELVSVHSSPLRHLPCPVRSPLKKWTLKRDETSDAISSQERVLALAIARPPPACDRFTLAV